MENHSVTTCHMPQEYTIILIYLMYVIIIIIYQILNKYKTQVNFKHYIKNKYIFNNKKSNTKVQ